MVKFNTYLVTLICKCISCICMELQASIYLEKLHFTILNYTSDYTLHPKLFECMFCTINYDHCYTFTCTSSLLLTWTEMHDTTWKYLSISLLNPLKINEKIYFTPVNYTLDYTLHPKFWFFIKINRKLDVTVQSVTMVIVYSAKCVFEKLRV